MALGDVNRIGTNIGALSALNALGDVNRQLQTSQLRLSTGKRITEASDDPAGFSIANKLSRTARGLSVALNGIQTFENLLSVAEGGISSIKDIVLAIRDLFVQASSDTVGVTERAAMNNQLTAMRAEVDRIAAQTSFNGTKLLDGSFVARRFQTGDSGGDYITFGITQNFSSSTLGSPPFGVLSNLNLSSAGSAGEFIMTIDSRIMSVVTTQLQQIGGMMQRVRLIENQLSTAATSTTAAKSRITDTDVAKEQATSTRLTIIRQLATAQLGHATLAPRSVLALLR